MQVSEMHTTNLAMSRSFCNQKTVIVILHTISFTGFEIIFGDQKNVIAMQLFSDEQFNHNVSHQNVCIHIPPYAQSETN